MGGRGGKNRNCPNLLIIFSSESRALRKSHLRLKGTRPKFGQFLFWLHLTSALINLYQKFLSLLPTLNNFWQLLKRGLSKWILPVLQHLSKIKLTPALIEFSSAFLLCHTNFFRQEVGMAQKTLRYCFNQPVSWMCILNILMPVSLLICGIKLQCLCTDATSQLMHTWWKYKKHMLRNQDYLLMIQRR